MPIYEFYCSDCHTLFHFLARTVSTDKTPACPRCGRPEIERRASSFAISKGRSEPPAEGPAPGLDEARLEQALESFAHGSGAIDEEDPKAAARWMRRLYETAGIPLGGGFDEALRRLEAGEDPEAVEAQMGDVLAGDPLQETPAAGRGALRRRLAPPRVDPELHEL